MTKRDIRAILQSKAEDVTIGCDPEVFFTRFGRVYPACGLIGGSKSRPIPVENGALQEDNVMAEFNTDPVTSCEEFVETVNSVYSTLEGVATENMCEIGITASALIDEEILNYFPEAKQFGCDPDFNAYTLRKNLTPDPCSLLRTCAGHIHLGYSTSEPHTIKDSAYLVKYLDAYVGTWCVITDQDTQRMTRYGQAGAFRHKPYGVEYRVPSNFWLLSDNKKRQIFLKTKSAYKAAKEGYPIPDEEFIQRIINNQSRLECKEVLSWLKY